MVAVGMHILERRALLDGTFGTQLVVSGCSVSPGQVIFSLNMRIKNNSKYPLLKIILGYGWQFTHTQAFPIVSNGAYQDELQMKILHQVLRRWLLF